MVRYVQVRIQVVDAAGVVVAQRYHSVVGDIAPGGRARSSWASPPPGGAAYRVGVTAFQQLGGGP